MYRPHLTVRHGVGETHEGSTRKARSARSNAERYGDTATLLTPPLTSLIDFLPRHQPCTTHRTVPPHRACPSLHHPHDCQITRTILSPPTHPPNAILRRRAPSPASHGAVATIFAPHDEPHNLRRDLSDPRRAPLSIAAPSVPSVPSPSHLSHLSRLHCPTCPTCPAYPNCPP